MMKTWKDIGFQLEITGDGSPSLRLIDGTPENGEAMHHSGGAAAETQLIYGTLVRDVYAAIDAPSFLSLGLGLGYNELLVAAEGLKHDRPFRLLSYESVPALSEAFVSWVEGFPLAVEVSVAYDDLSRRLEPEVDVAKLRSALAKARREGRWRVFGALGEDTLPPEKCHGFMYDAFSSKTSPELWSQDFLERFLASGAAPDARLATYACTGNLKRALKSQGFTVEIRGGFQGKRNSTYAYRG